MLLLLLILTSCASRQVHIDKIDIKKDSVAETKIKVKTVENKEKEDVTNITTNTDCSEITITPIDSSKTIIVDGKSYKNVVLKIKKTKTNTLYSNKKKELETKLKDSIATIKVQKSERVIGKKKDIDKKANYWWIIWLLLLILILYLLWRNKTWILKRL
jgi:preprotein translocase subunit SecF